jgi:hypothetical protein
MKTDLPRRSSCVNRVEPSEKRWSGRWEVIEGTLGKTPVASITRLVESVCGGY